MSVPNEIHTQRLTRTGSGRDGRTMKALAGVCAFAAGMASAAAGDLFVSTDAGGGLVEEIVEFETSLVGVGQFQPFGTGFTGGVRVAVGDVDGDGVADIVTAPGAGSASQVRVVSGTTGQVIRSFFAYDNFTGGVFVATGDVNDDGVDDIITGPGSGAAPLVRVFNGSTGALIDEFLPFAETFTGGVRVASADLDGDGVSDIVTGAGPGGGPQVKVFSGDDKSVIGDFFAFSPSFTGGVYVAAGSIVNGSPTVVVAPDSGGEPTVTLFDPDGTLQDSFFAFDVSFTGGVRVAVGDVDHDDFSDIIVGTGTGASAVVRVYDAATHGIRQQSTVFDGFTDGIYIAAPTSGTTLTKAPIIDPNGGVFNDFEFVVISSGTPGASIYYTLDGSVPTTESTLFTGFIFLDQSTRIRAIATSERADQSAVSTADFLSSADANTPPDLQVTGKRKITTSGKKVQIRGNASAPLGVKKVEFRQKGEKWQKAKGASSWKATVNLTKKRTVVQFRAVGNSGKSSKVESVTVLKKSKKR